MLLGLGLFLMFVWVLAFLALHVAGGLIHVLVLLGLISIIFHFLRRPRPA